jgi:integrase
MVNSTRRRRPRNHQSAKPYPDFPLTAHPSGRWCKKVKGKVIFFGKIDDPQAALDKWLAEKDELLAGRVPRAQLPEGVTLRDLAIAYLRQQKASMDNGELSSRTFQDNHRTCASLIEHFGKHRLLDDMRQDDFAAYRVALAKRLGPVSLGNSIQRVRSIFKFALESGMVKTLVLFGPGFKRPSKKTLRLERAKKGPKLFSRDELRKLIDAAGIPMKAMILLACNAGFGNSDLANMPLSSVDLQTGWVDFPRPKTGIARRFPLWPETLAALGEVIAKRPTPKAEADVGLLFITKYGAKWAKAIFELRQAEPGAEPAADETAKTYRVNNDSAIAKEFIKLFAVAELQRKPGRSFYTIRHVFETIAGESRDQVAVDAVMGHARDDMASIYRERISDERLKAVTDHVRGWLFPPTNTAKP